MKPGIVALWLLLVAAIVRADQYSDLFQKAAAHSQQGNYEQAILDYKAALEIRPNAPEALNNLAVMYYEAHKYPEAFDTASKIWETHPELKSASLITGMAAVQCNRPNDAIAPLERLTSADPSNRDALLALASAHVALNQIPEGDRHLSAGNTHICQTTPPPGTVWRSATSVAPNRPRKSLPTCLAGRATRSGS